LDPFSLEKAREYIDMFADPPKTGQTLNYIQTRDLILNRLSGAFADENGQFLSFIGYPPVLDAIATLFREEKNYHRLTTELGDGTAGMVEKNLLHRIASYIIERERVEKVLPNLVQDLLLDLPPEEKEKILKIAYSVEEQCARLIAYCLGEQIDIKVFGHPPLDAKYESGLSRFLAEHPFIQGREFRNAVFEAMAVAVLIASSQPMYVELVNRYSVGRKNNYHLIYLLNEIAPNHVLPSSALHILIGAALELRSTKSATSITLEPTLEATEHIGTEANGLSITPISISLEVFTLDSGHLSKKFCFNSEVSADSVVQLGNKLQSCFIEIPCRVILSGSEVEFSAPIVIFAKGLDFRATALIVKARSGEDGFGREVILEAENATSTLTTISVEGAEFTLRLTDRSGNTYPLVKYIQPLEDTRFTGDLKDKYLKLRKILTHFRSHSKGELAKYRDKVDNERVAGNDVGGRVLARLLEDDILYASGIFYFLRPANVDKYLGIPWTALRAGMLSDKLVEYLKTI